MNAADVAKQTESSIGIADGISRAMNRGMRTGRREGGRWLGGKNYISDYVTAILDSVEEVELIGSNI